MLDNVKSHWIFLAILAAISVSGVAISAAILMTGSPNSSTDVPCQNQHGSLGVHGIVGGLAMPTS